MYLSASAAHAANASILCWVGREVPLRKPGLDSTSGPGSLPREERLAKIPTQRSIAWQFRELVLRDPSNLHTLTHPISGNSGQRVLNDIRMELSGWPSPTADLRRGVKIPTQQQRGERRWKQAVNHQGSGMGWCGHAPCVAFLVLMRCPARRKRPGGVKGRPGGVRRTTAGVIAIPPFSTSSSNPSSGGRGCSTRGGSGRRCRACGGSGGLLRCSERRRGRTADPHTRPSWKTDNTGPAGRSSSHRRGRVCVFRQTLAAVCTSSGDNVPPLCLKRRLHDVDLMSVSPVLFHTA
jgi:hypothetical protein